VHSTGNNDGELNASGLDIKIDGMIETDGAGTFRPSLILTKSLSYEQQAYYKGPVQETKGFSYQPELRWVMNVGWNMGPHTVEWSANFIGDYGANDSIVFQGTEAVLETSSEKVDTWTTMNLSYTYDADKYGKIKIGSTNITNEDPVLDSEGKFPSDSYDLYDQTGRVIYTEYTVEF
jgi:iron complex outermembrane receptor protein